MNTIDDLIDKEGYTEDCEECGYYNEWQEGRPYGMTTAYETLAECKCDDNDKCPRLQSHKIQGQ